MSAIVEKLEKISCGDTMRCVCLQRIYVPRCGCGDRKGWGNRAAALRVPEQRGHGNVHRTSCRPLARDPPFPGPR